MVSRTAIVGGYVYLIALVLVPGLTAASPEAVKDICKDASNPEACINSIASARNNTDRAIKLLSSSARDPKTAGAYGSCQEFLDDSVDDLEMARDKMDSFDGNEVKQLVEDLESRLTGVLTYEDSCLDNYGAGETHDRLSDLLKETRELATNSLALVTEFSKFFSEHKS